MVLLRAKTPEFHEVAGVFNGMRTTLHQSGRKVVLDHSGCKVDYLAALSDALAAGMSLRITYGSDTTRSFFGVDEPLCGQQSCSSHDAGKAVISNIAIEKMVWAVDDPRDPLFQHVIPDEVVKNREQFVTLGSFGVAQWKSATHFVQRQAMPASPPLPGLEDCDDEVAGPCQTSLKKEGFLHAFVKKYEGLPKNAVAVWATSGAHRASAVAAACLVVLSALAAVRLGRRSAERRGEANMPVPPPMQNAPAGGNLAQVPWRTHAGETGARPGNGLGGAISTSCSRGLPRSGSSCQQLLAINEEARHADAC